MLAANGSIFTILAISFERYYAICKPLKAGYKCTRLRATIIICLIWLLACILTSPILIMAKSTETPYIDGTIVNTCILVTDSHWHKIYVFFSLFAFFCLPLLVLMLVYWLISRRLIRESLAMMSNHCTTGTTMRNGSIKRASTSTTATTVTTATCCALNNAPITTMTITTQHGDCQLASTTTRCCGLALSPSRFASSHHRVDESRRSSLASLRQQISWCKWLLCGGLIGATSSSSSASSASDDFVKEPSDFCCCCCCAEQCRPVRSSKSKLAKTGKAVSLDVELDSGAGVRQTLLDEAAFLSHPSQPATSHLRRKEESNGHINGFANGNSSGSLIAERKGRAQDKRNDDIVDQQDEANDEQWAGLPFVAFSLKILLAIGVAHPFSRARRSSARCLSKSEGIPSIGAERQRLHHHYTEGEQKETSHYCQKGNAINQYSASDQIKEQSKISSNAEVEAGRREPEEGAASDRHVQAGAEFVRGSTGARGTISCPVAATTNTNGRPPRIWTEKEGVCSSAGPLLVDFAKCGPTMVMPRVKPDERKSASDIWLNEGAQGKRSKEDKDSPGDAISSHLSSSWIGQDVTNTSPQNGPSDGDQELLGSQLGSPADSRRTEELSEIKENRNKSGVELAMGQLFVNGAAQQRRRGRRQSATEVDKQAAKRSRERTGAHSSDQHTNLPPTTSGQIYHPKPIIHCQGEFTSAGSLLVGRSGRAANEDRSQTYLATHKCAHFDLATNDGERQEASSSPPSRLENYPSLLLESARCLASSTNCDQRQGNGDCNAKTAAAFLAASSGSFSSGCGPSAATDTMSHSLKHDQISASSSGGDQQQFSEQINPRTPAGPANSLQDPQQQFQGIMTTRTSIDSGQCKSLSPPIENDGSCGTFLLVNIKQSNAPKNGARNDDYDHDNFNDDDDNIEDLPPRQNEHSSLQQKIGYKLRISSTPMPSSISPPLGHGKGFKRPGTLPSPSSDIEEYVGENDTRSMGRSASNNYDHHQHYPHFHSHHIHRHHHQHRNHSQGANLKLNLMTMAHNITDSFHLKRTGRRSGSQPIVCTMATVNGHFNNSCHSAGQPHQNQDQMPIIRDINKKQQMDSRRQVVVMLAFVVACFFLLFLPYRVFTIWLILSTTESVESLGMETYYNLTYFSRILIYLHSAINPIAYNLISTKFRRAFMSILLCGDPAARRHFAADQTNTNYNNHLQHHQGSSYRMLHDSKSIKSNRSLTMTPITPATGNTSTTSGSASPALLHYPTAHQCTTPRNQLGRHQLSMNRS